MSDEGIMDVRVVHDGTHGVGVNPLIKVRDAAPTPMAQDSKATMRRQAASGIPHCGLTVDVDAARTYLLVR